MTSATGARALTAALCLAVVCMERSKPEEQEEVFHELQQVRTGGHESAAHGKHSSNSTHLHEGGSHGSHEDAGAHHVPSEKDVAMALMLLGVVLAIVAFFYLLHHSDADIRFHTWNIVGKGMTIFLAVSLFVNTRNFLCSLWAHFTTSGTLVVDGLLFLAFWTGLQVTGWRCAAMDGEEETKLGFREMPDHGVVRCSVKRKAAAVATYVSLAAHVTGFAALHFLSQIDDRKVVKAVLPVITLIGLTFLLTLTKKVRYSLAISDGTFDAKEKEFYELANHAESESFALAVSFLAIQALRCYISQVCPDSWGNQDMRAHHDYLSCLTLFGIGICCLLLGVFMARRRIFNEGKHDNHHEVTMPEFCGGSIFLSLESLFTESLIFTAGWCNLIAGVWVIRLFPGMKDVEDRMSVRVCSCLFSTASAVTAILVLDFILDRVKVRGVGNTVTASLAVGVGFSWERCFDQAFHILAYKVVSGDETWLSHGIMLFLSLGAAAVTVPPMLWYVIPSVLLAKQDRKLSHKPAQSTYVMLQK